MKVRISSAMSLLLFSLLFVVGCGGGNIGSGQINPPPPPAPTVNLLVNGGNSATINQGQPVSLTWTTTGATSCAASASPAEADWSSNSEPTSNTVGVSVQPPATAKFTLTCTGPGGNTPSSVTVTVTASQAPAISISGMASKVLLNNTSQFTASVTGGNNATTAWFVNGVSGGSATVGTISSNGLYTAPAVVPNPAAVVITATATDAAGSGNSNQVSITVYRNISIGLTSAIPNNEIYLEEQGALVPLTFGGTCIEPGDTLNIESIYGPLGQVAFNAPAQPTCVATVNWSYVLDASGFSNYVPGKIKFWVTGSDGATSNSIYLYFGGSLNMASQDITSGELYYDYTGNSTSGSNAILEFTSAGTANGKISNASGFQSAFDNTTKYVVQSGIGGVGWYNSSSGAPVNSAPMGVAPNSYSYNLAVNSGNVCAVQTIEGTVSCAHEAPAGPQPSVTVVASGLNQPTAVVMPTPTTCLVLTRGDSTLHGFDFSGSTPVATGTLVLSGFTPYNANFTAQYPYTGGWSMLMVGNTVGILGQAVSGSGVGQLLALVDGPSMTLLTGAGDQGYVTLPPGTIQIAVDAGNAAFGAEYPDASGPTPVTRVVRVNPQTGTITKLNATSTLVPASGFLVTVNGELAFFVQGNIDLEPNQ